MKKILFIPLFLFLAYQIGISQQSLSLGGGYFSQQITSPGAVLNLEYNKGVNENLSVFWRSEACFYRFDNSINVFTLDINRGFRKQLTNSFWVEQSIGAGVLASFYEETLWHEFEDGNLIFIGEGKTFDLLASVGLGIGLDISKEKQGSDQLWLRSKMSLQIPNRELSKPLFGLMVGYSHTFKTFKS